MPFLNFAGGNSRVAAGGLLFLVQNFGFQGNRNSIPNSVHDPLIREYNLDTQYEFAPGWVLDVAYVGSSGINLMDFNHNRNQALLATPTNAYSYLCSGTPPICNTEANAQFRVPYSGYTTYGLQANGNESSEHSYRLSGADHLGVEIATRITQQKIRMAARSLRRVPTPKR